MCHLQELYAKYKDKGLVVLGFNASDEKKIALEMLHDNGANFPNILDVSEAATKVCYNQYRRSGMNGVPLSYLIDREGKIADAWYGFEEGESRGNRRIAQDWRPIGRGNPQGYRRSSGKGRSRSCRCGTAAIPGSP